MKTDIPRIRKKIRANPRDFSRRIQPVNPLEQPPEHFHLTFPNYINMNKHELICSIMGMDEAKATVLLKLNIHTL